VHNWSPLDELQIVGDPLGSTITQGNHTRYLIYFAFRILPPTAGGASDIVGDLEEARQENLRNKNFHALMIYNMNKHGPTATFLLESPADSWSFKISDPRIANQDVRRPADYGAAVLLPMGDDSDVISLSSHADPCSVANEPCACAQHEPCAWGGDSDGIMSCFYSPDDAHVPCSSCPTQDNCMTETCSEKLEACQCAIFQGCRWDDAAMRCQHDQFGFQTSCAACALQPKCSTPSISQFIPPSGSLLALGITSLQFVFNMAMRIRQQWQGTGVTLRCKGWVHDVDIAMEDLSITGDRLTIDITDFVGSYSSKHDRICDVLIAPGLFEDQAGVQYLGLGRVTQPKYTFEISDMVVPYVKQFSPPQLGIAIDAVVRITFTEVVSFGDQSALQASLTIVNEREESVPTEGEVPTGPIEFLMSAPRVTIQNQELLFDLSGLTEPGTLYSLTIPAHALFDEAENPFAGLGLGTATDYMFRTRPATVVFGRDDEEQGMLEIFAFAAIAAVALIGMVCAVIAWRVHRMRGRLRHGSGQPHEGLDENKVKTAVTPHSPGPRSFVQVPNTVPPPLGSAAFKKSKTSPDFTSAGFVSSSPHSQPPIGSEHVPISRSTSTYSVFESAAYAPMRHAATTPVTEWARSISKESFGTFGTKGIQGKTMPTAESGNPPTEKSTRKVHPEPDESTNKASTASTRKPGPANATADKAADGRSSAERRASSSSPKGESKRTRRSKTTGDMNDGPSKEGSRGPFRQAEGSADSKPRHSESKAPFKAKVPFKDNQAEGTSTPLSVHSVDDFEVNPSTKKKIERRLRDAMDAPLVDRKKLMKELMFEYHPDKNQASDAKEIFQFVNSSKSWFICEG
jgi:hypothetical protein